jgi:predicted Zn-dependent protease
VSRRGLGLVALGLALVLVGCESGGGISGVGGTILGGMTQGLTGVNPADVQGAATEIDEPEEIELGRSVTTAIGSRYKLLRDEAITRYVALVGNSVALQSDRPDLRYYFAVLDTDEVNAFAAPGGYVFITRGTLALIRDEATLAGVLGHEVGHIALRHHVKTIKAEKKAAVGKGLTNTATRIGVGFIPGIGGSVASVAANSPLLNAVTDKLADTVYLKGFSYDEEGEADVVGFKYAARAGYDPAGLRDFLKAVQDSGKQPSKSGALQRFVATHPGADDRLKAQENQLKTAPAGGRRAAPRFETAMAASAKAAAQPAQPASKSPAQPTR